MPHHAVWRSTVNRLVSAWPVWGPLLPLLVYVAPFISFMLPSRMDHLGEVYQPLQALKFFATRGTTYHKYGPCQISSWLPSMAYPGVLVLDRSLSKPSDDFPYGFSHSLPQLGFLILEHRLFFLVLGLAAFAYLGHRLATATDSPLARALAMLFCVQPTTRSSCPSQPPGPIARCSRFSQPPSGSIS